MEAERWQRVKEGFHEALDLEGAARGAFFARLRRDDPDLADEVESLVENHETPTTLGDLIPGTDDLETDETLDERWIGRQLGAYRIERRLGRGGMGSVFLARRTDGIDARVAIKLVQSPGQSDKAEGVVQRFLDERRILAQLVHPHIARMLDGGKADDETPYLVLEYVDGVPLDVYCNERRLGVRERLELMATVCEAVHFAHQNLVVHRDLKPSNILVTDDGSPKLLDFGIAKLLNPDFTPAEGRTRTLARAPMTPDFASPEQFLGEPVSTASDVYALGVLAHRVLTGRSPYGEEDPGWAELARRVCTRPPEPPSVTVERRIEAGDLDDWRLPEPPRKVAGLLAGDLDAIVARALVKHPAGRYPSADELAREIRRHLGGLPVRARGDGFGYVASRWLGRRKAWWVAGALLALSIFLGLSATVRQERIADRERQRAERRFAEVRDLANTFLFDVHDAIAPLPGSTEARRKIADTGSAYLERLADERGDDPELTLELARSFARMGDVQGEPRRASLGDTEAATASYRRALDLFEGVSGRFDAADLALQRAGLHRRLGELAVLRGDAAEADAELGRALGLVRSVHERRDDPEVREALAAVYDSRGWAGRRFERLEEALDAHHQALELREALAAAEPEDPERRHLLSRSLVQAGDVHDARGEAEAALALYQRAMAIDEALVAAQPLHRDRVHALVASSSRVGEVLDDLGRRDEALVVLRRALASAERLARADPFDARARRSVAILLNLVADILLETGRAVEATASYTASLQIRRELYALDPSNLRSRREVGVSLYKLADARAAEASGADPDRVRESLEAARQRYVEALTWFLAMCEEDQLDPVDVTVPDDLRERLEAVQAALSGDRSSG